MNLASYLPNGIAFTSNDGENSAATVNAQPLLRQDETSPRKCRFAMTIGVRSKNPRTGPRA